MARIFKRNIVRLFFRIARSSLGRVLVSWMFVHMSFAIPVHRLRETRTLVAFFHPQPSYPVHVLLVPKRAVGDLSGLTAADADFFLDLFQTVASLVSEFRLDEPGYRLILNGGSYQDVPQIHFHLISGHQT